MSEEKQYQIETASEDSHIIHLKHQVKINFDENYNYYIKNPIKKFLSKVFMTFAVPLFKVIHYLGFGLKIKNKKILKALRKQKTAFITIANHCLILDSTMSVATTFPKTLYMPTVEPTMKIPVARLILRAGNVMPIPFNIRGLVKFKNDCNEILKNGKVLHYFPEGALWPYYGKLREFKPGAFRFAVDANVPVLPYCFYFRERRGLWKLLGKKPLVTLEVIKPIYPDNSLSKKDAINDLMNKSHSAMKQIIDLHPYDNPKYKDIEEQLQNKENINQ